MRRNHTVMFASGNDFEKEPSRYLNYLFNQNQLFDIVIHVENETFHAHKIVLGSSSKYFSDSFREDFTLSKITLEGISASTFRKILNFMYSGEIDVNLNEEAFAEIFKTALILQIISLRSLCEKYLEMIMKKDLWKASDLACVYGIDNVYNQALMQLRTDFMHHCNETGFLMSDKDKVMLILCDDNLIVDSELDVFFSVVRWLEYNREERMKYAKELLECVRFPLMSFDECYICGYKASDIPDLYRFISYSFWMKICKDNKRNLVSQFLTHNDRPRSQSKQQCKEWMIDHKPSTTPACTSYLQSKQIPIKESHYTMDKGEKYCFTRITTLEVENRDSIKTKIIRQSFPDSCKVHDVDISQESLVSVSPMPSKESIPYRESSTMSSTHTSNYYQPCPKPYKKSPPVQGLIHTSQCPPPQVLSYKPPTSVKHIPVLSPIPVSPHSLSPCEPIRPCTPDIPLKPQEYLDDSQSSKRTTSSKRDRCVSKKKAKSTCKKNTDSSSGQTSTKSKRRCAGKSSGSEDIPHLSTNNKHYIKTTDNLQGISHYIPAHELLENQRPRRQMSIDRKQFYSDPEYVIHNYERLEDIRPASQLSECKRQNYPASEHINKEAREDKRASNQVSEERNQKRPLSDHAIHNSIEISSKQSKHKMLSQSTTEDITQSTLGSENINHSVIISDEIQSGKYYDILNKSVELSESRSPSKIAFSEKSTSRQSLSDRTSRPSSAEIESPSVDRVSNVSSKEFSNQGGQTIGISPPSYHYFSDKSVSRLSEPSQVRTLFSKEPSTKHSGMYSKSFQSVPSHKENILINVTSPTTPSSSLSSLKTTKQISNKLSNVFSNKTLSDRSSKLSSKKVSVHSITPQSSSVSFNLSESLQEFSQMTLSENPRRFPKVHRVSESESVSGEEST